MRVTAIALLFLTLGAAPAEAGGPTIEMKACTVHRVEAGANKVVFTVSGRCALALPDPDKEKGRLKWVDTTLERCVITVVQGEVYWTDTWAEYQAAAKAIEGKAAWMQLRGAITLD